MYCAICTSTWCKVPDESFVSESFEEALSFCLKREPRLRAAQIIKVDGEKEEEILSFRSIK
jgi:hypothetical protein